MSNAISIIRESEEAILQLFQAGDLEGVMRFYSKDLVCWPETSKAPKNKIQTTQSIGNILAGIKQGTITYELIEKSIQDYGEVIISYYTMSYAYQNTKGQYSKISYQFTHTWMKQQKAWKIIGGMSSNVQITHSSINNN